MSGPPGSGKTLLARSMPSILPRMTPTEALDVTRIYSVAGMLPGDVPLIRHRPFRTPHHTISHAGSGRRRAVAAARRDRTAGGGSLAHRGVLFLDEMPEFGQHGLEVLRQPLEDRIVTISRAQGSLTFPANFMLVDAQDPCPCGYRGNPEHTCTCSPMLISRYQKRLSGSLLDRTDIRLAAIRAHVEAAPGASNGPVQQPKDELGASLTTNADIDRPRSAITVRWTGPAATPKVLGAAMQRCRSPIDHDPVPAATDGMIGQPDYGFTPTRWLTPFRSPERRG